MRARFIGDPRNEGDGPRVMKTFGLEFTGDRWVTLTTGFQRRNRAAIDKMIGNDHFEVEDDAGQLLSPPSKDANAPDDEFDDEDEGGSPPNPNAGDVEIPTGWDEQSAADLRKLAAQIAGKPVPNKDTAVQVIEGELARRAANPAQD